MSPLARQRTALFLYTVLVLLPAAVFGGLHWHQLEVDHSKQLERMPLDTEDAARRLVTGIRERVDALLQTENEREFYLYQQDYFEESTTFSEGRPLPTPIPSPLAIGPRPAGIRVWFSWDYRNALDVEPLLLTGAPPSAQERSEYWSIEATRRMELEDFVVEFLIVPIWMSAEAIIDELAFREVSPREMPAHLVALNLNPQRDADCIARDLAALAETMGTERGTVNVRTGPFELRALRDERGAVRVVALRLVHIARLPHEVEPPRCFENLVSDNILAQGFEIDVDWLLLDLPWTTAQQVLGGSMRFHAPGEPTPVADDDTFVATEDLFATLDVELDDPTLEAVARMHVATDIGEMRRAFRVQLLWLLGVAVVMVASLAFGIRLLLGSVRSSLEQARRTENFVAAVTHELRTPLASVKMYGEMLHDGWAKDEEKRSEYLERILRETDRLGDLVDKVLQKRRLSGAPANPEPGDLNLEISALAPGLAVAAGEDHGDLVFDLGPDLPPVLLSPEAVREVLVNLVENARKYAPVQSRGDEPIRVVTRLNSKRRVLLEVLDRGPGIPEEERGRIFEAFYRIGDEKTRRTVGTGLGLHLAQLQVRSMRGRLQALGRSGGGTVFRVTFKTQKPSARGEPRAG